jgi:hypothetical protein
MSSDDYYRKQASEAQQHADRAISDLDRASWLRIAQSWLGLIRIKLTGQEEFDAETRERGTGQDVSDKSQ